MDIATDLLVGESISYAKDDIITALKKDEIPKKIHWYGVTTSFDERNLMYILTGLEYRHPMYHRPDKKMKLLGLAGSRAEALAQVQTIVQHHVDTNTLMNMKESLAEY